MNLGEAGCRIFCDHDKRVGHCSLGSKLFPGIRSKVISTENQASGIEAGTNDNLLYQSTENPSAAILCIHPFG